MRAYKPRKPMRLNKGDTVGIVAPAWSFDQHKFRQGVNKLRTLGFRVKFERSIFSRYWSMAGYDRERAGQINRMFADKSVKAIFCAKAGYGSIRTIPYLNKHIIRRNPKIFIGYSDITILLSYLYKVGRMVVFHGPVVAGEIHENMNSVTLHHLLKAITDPASPGEERFPTIKTIRSGRGSGILVGGNMSLLVNAIGTPYDINTDNKILFLEDVGEDLETIDHYLMHFKLAGKLRKIKGMVLGRMLGCIDRSGKKHNIKNVLCNILSDVKVPIIYGFPSGHKVPGELNVTLPFGVSVTLDAYKPALIFNESGVR
ncbi:MAG: LD-carboxypeptidase [Candidatus Omnitrophica bacterium]|nr:LD-carboxypeptidase [Candidatus Omnitrophota bacterium]MBU4590091.1 LD-carboxypeptidase [Candidatus Omnitrophota bacterium]